MIPELQKLQNFNIYIFFFTSVGGVTQEGGLTRKGASRSMQQVWEELTGKHYGCNIGDTCTHRTHSKHNIHHK